MLWVTFRQHRSELIGAAVLLVVLGVVLIASGRSMHDAYQTSGTAACLRASGDGDACDQIVGAFTDRYVRWGDLFTMFNLLPAFVGVFVGAPLLARELDHGTWRLAFTQSVTRTRWFFMKLVLVGAGVLTFGVAVTALFTWWRGPLDTIDGRIGPTAFGFEGPTLATSMVFAFALGVLAGAVMRKTVAAMAVSFIAFFVVRTPVEVYLRPRYQEPLLRVRDATAESGGSGRTTDWVLSQGWIDAAGQRLTPGERLEILRQLRGSGPSIERYMQDNGLKQFVEYQPNSAFWHFQTIEALILGTIAIACLATSVWLVSRRTS